VQFIEFGLKLVVRPTVLENGKISIVLDQSISQPDYTNAIQILGAPIPSFTLKTVSTITESDSGETWAVAGLLSEEDRKSLKSVPWISKVPIIGWLFQNKDDSTSRNELIILVNARRVDGVNKTTTNFDESGDLSTNQATADVSNEAFLTEQESVPAPMAPEKSKKPIASNKKAKTARAVTEATMMNNNAVKMAAPTKTWIRPNPPNGRNYREIKEPTVLNNPLNQ
jgi:pilus assembly protein CpaC